MEQGEPQKTPFPFVSLISFLAGMAALLALIREGVLANQSFFSGAILALEHVDVFAMSNAFASGTQSYHGVLNANTPFMQLYGGAAAMWAQMAAGGPWAIFTGALIVIASVGLYVAAAAGSESDRPYLAWPSNGWFGLAAICIVVCVGLSLLGAFARTFPGAMPANWIDSSLRDLAKAPGGIFVVTHIGFASLCIGVGLVVVIAIAGLASTNDTFKVLLLFLLPYVLVPILFSGSVLALLIERVLLIQVIALLLKLSVVVVFPSLVYVVGMALDRAHLGITLVESGRKLFLRR